ncbi:hypothetical protein [Variovorax paradoxus]|uniref:Uncharacterized protein n=1 Tax=Variovorax paradoxus TaxID=34073 RepID=A0A0H2M0M6_VARPD|nr:hypothetical protein [Variovorax paradoxus]KLN55953.1 hypothetical protein VPARA_29880 [Variovorax paradoxus]
MTDGVAPEYSRFVAAERRAQRLPAAATRPMAEGEVFKPVSLEAKQATEFFRIAARRASGLYRPSRRNEVVWVEGENELAVSLTGLQVQLADGLIRVTLPVRCDQTGSAVVEVVFAVGTDPQPAGLYAATYRRPNGPALIVDTWGEALVAFAWQGVLGMVSGIAGALGKDARGNVLVPVELTASKRGLQIVPMARHRFAGSSGLKAVKGATP